MNNTKDISGVGGFLAVIIFSLIIIIPTFGVWELINSLRDLGKNTTLDKVIIIFAVLQLIAFGLNISAGIRLLKTLTPNSVSYAVKIIWINYFLINLIGLLLVSYTVNQSINFNLLKETAFFHQLLLCIFLTLYFKKSKRVRNTYVYKDN